MDSAAEGTDGRGGAEEHDIVSVATAMSASDRGVASAGTTSIRSRAITASSVSLALELERVRNTGDARDPARDVHGTVYRIGRPDVTGELRHAVIDADLDVTEIVDRIGLEGR